MKAGRRLASPLRRGPRAAALALAVGLAAATTGGLRAAERPLVFAVAADMRSFAGPGAYDSSRYFRGACEAIKAAGDVSSLISPGDVDPPAGVRWTLDAVLGAGFPWYPATGNHDADSPAGMAWLRALNPEGHGLPGVVAVFTASAPSA